MIRSTTGIFFALIFGALPAQAQSVGDFSVEACFDQSAGAASCQAVCPSGKAVLNCGYTLGNYSSGDTCQSISRIGVLATGPSGQPTELPNDRCDAHVQCSDGSQTVTVQLFATCLPM